MPLYEYVCTECDERFEELRPASQADTGVACPACESPEVERRFSTFATGGGGASTRGASSGGASCGPRGFT